MTKKTHPKGRRAQPKKTKTGMILGIGGGALAVVIALIVVLGGSAPTAKAAPTWEAQSIDGQKISGVGLKGDVYALDYFFTWCPICAKQYPHKAALVSALADRPDFHFISVSADPSDTPVKLQQYKESHGATWTFVSDQYGLYQKFNVNSRPYIVFVDRDGNIQKTITRITDAKDLIAIAEGLLDAPATIEDPNLTAQAFAPVLVAPAGATLTLNARGPRRVPPTKAPAPAFSPVTP